MVSFFRFIARFPKTVILLSILLSIFFTEKIRKGLFDSRGTLILNTTIEPIMSRKSGAFDFFKEVQRMFGKNELLVVAITRSDHEKPGVEFIEKYFELGVELKNLKGIQTVIGLIDIPLIFSECPGTSHFHVRNFSGCTPSCISLDKKYRTELAIIAGTEKCSSVPRRSMDEVRAQYDVKVQKVLEGFVNEPVIVKDLIGTAGKTLAYMVVFSDNIRPSESSYQKPVADLAAKYKKKGIVFAWAGKSRLEHEASRIIQNDIKQILPLGILLMVFVLALSFKRLTGVIVPIFIVGVGLFWTAGIFAMTTFRLNLMTIVLPPLLISVGSAYVIHILHQYYYEAPLGGNFIERIVEKMTTPLIVTALTTIAGFAALTISPIPAIQELGIFACIGISVIIFLSLTLAVAILSILPPPRKKPDKAQNYGGILDRFLTFMGRMIIAHSRRFIIAWMILGVVAIAGIALVRVDSDPKNFPDDSPVQKDLELIQNNLAGTTTFQMVVTGDGKSPAFNLETSKKLYDYIEWIYSAKELKEIKGVSLDKVYSPIQYLDLFVRNFGTNIKSLDQAQFVFLTKKLKEFKVPTFVSNDGKHFQLLVRMKINSSTGLIKLRELLNKYFVEHFPGYSLRFTGTGILASESADSISKGQITSVGLALTVIFIILSILFFSVKMGGLALYPNLVAIAVFFGTLGWFSIPVGVTISVIASIALGIGVDNTIHFLSHFNEEVKISRDEKQASLDTLRHVGPPMIYTTVSLGLGFGIFAISDMSAQVLFGVLMAFTLFVCLIAGLNFLPSIVVQSRLITAWDYLSLSYDSKFISEISLFKGMSLRTTKIATLMAYTVELNDGDVLFQPNDRGNELYAVLEGSVVIRVKTPDEIWKDIGFFPQGSTLGEIALFQRTYRTTQAVAVGHTKLLVLNEKTLLRLKRRYPKIASKLLINLSKNLLDAITNTNHTMVDSLFESMKPMSPFYGKIDNIVNDIEKKGYLSYTGKANLEEVLSRVAEKSRIADLVRRTQNGEIEIRPHDEKFMFQGFNAKDINLLKKIFTVETYHKDDVIYRQGEQGNSFGIVLSGVTKLSVVRPQGEMTVATAHYGHLVGHGSILAPESKYHETVTALESCELLIIDKEKASEVLSSRPALASQFSYNLVCSLADRLENLMMKLHLGQF